MTATSSLQWPNDNLTLVASGETGYTWLADLPPIRPVQAVGSFGVGTGTGLLVHGDALDAIHGLAADGRLRERSIKLLYIDPPFGTGKKFGHYKDNLAEAAWLSMIRDRLAAVLPYLASEGSIWVHLDETMSHKARMILDDLLGQQAYVATVIWQKRLTVESRTAISSSHDPILVYAVGGSKSWKRYRNRVPGTVQASNRDGDLRGPWRDAPFSAPGFRSGQQYTITNPAGLELKPPRGRSWFATEPVFRRLLQEDRIWWTRNGAGQPRMKNFDIDSLQVPSTIWSGKEVGTNDDAKRHLSALFPDCSTVFDTPKPERLLKRIIEIASNPGDTVMDLFAGSGTTASVAQKLGRKWVTCERLQTTVAQFLIPRLAAVVAGQDGGIPALATAPGSFEVLVCPPRVGQVGDVAAEFVRVLEDVSARTEVPPSVKSLTLDLTSQAPVTN